MQNKKLSTKEGSEPTGTQAKNFRRDAASTTKKKLSPPPVEAPSYEEEDFRVRFHRFGS